MVAKVDAGHMRRCDWRYGKLALILLLLFGAPYGEVYGQSKPACRELSQPLNLADRTWWRHYQRGINYAKDQCWQAAAKEFRAAIAQRPQDTHRARTQGLKFIAYFPHRELGIAYYHLERYAEAVHELETSLKHTTEQNEIAQDYLRQAQQAFSEQPASSRTIGAICKVRPRPLLDFNWWNYYQRGTTYAEGGCCQEAIRDFQAAIAQRPQDAHRARTFGLRFIPYFPHRELGIVYYHMGRDQQAIRELETSLEHVANQNERAEEFLSRARNRS